MVKPLLENVRSELPTRTYQVKLDENDKLKWVANIDGDEVTETKEPLTNWWRRFQAGFYKILPEGQL